MRKLKEIWLGLDIINRIILISGILACIWFVVKGRGLYGAALVVLMGMLMVSRKNNREKRLSRLYGGFHFHMPDGEIVPMSFEQVSTEYVKGQQGKYADRLVSLWFPYWRINEDGMLDTGFGLEIDLTGFDDPNGLLPLLKKGDFIYVTGRVQAERRDYFRIDRVEELRRKETRP